MGCDIEQNTSRLPIHGAEVDAWNDERRQHTRNLERPSGNNADEWTMWFFEYAGHGAQFLGVQIAEALDEHMERSALLDRSQIVRFFPIDVDHAVCVGGKFDGWLMWKHPDGQWVSQRKLNSEYPGRMTNATTA